MVKPRSNDDEGRKWRRKIERYELLYDKYKMVWEACKTEWMTADVSTRQRAAVNMCSDFFGGSRIFLVDSSVARSVEKADNYDFNNDCAAKLPFGTVWLEFSSPIKTSLSASGRHSLAAIVFSDGSHDYLPGAYFYFLPKSEVVDIYPHVGCEFWEEDRYVSGSEEFYGVKGLHPKDDRIPTITGNHRDQVLRVARNFYDMLTCRQFHYVQHERPKPRKDLSEFRRFKHNQYTNATAQRLYYKLQTVREVRKPGQDKRRPESIGSPCRVAVPGCFHHWIYCKWCMEHEESNSAGVHRHDLIGQPCRNCGRLVESRNIHVEPYWHAPYIRGKDGPLKERVFHVV